MNRIAFVTLIGILAAFVAVISSLSDTHKVALAQSVAYDYAWYQTNVYSNTAIQYEFDNLDINQSYQWGIYTVNPANGQLDRYLGMRILGPGVTSGTWVAGTATSVATPILYPEGYTGPLAVTDAFQQNTIIGRHFVVSLPSTGLNASGWTSAAGNTAVNDKQVTGAYQKTGQCQNPFYANVNLDGWLHTFVPCSVLVQSGQYTIFHYQVDPAYVGPTDMVFQFFPIPTTTVVLTVDMDDLLAFQQPASALITPIVFPNQYVVLNTNGREKPFINGALAQISFVTEDNPTTASFETGVYNYMRVDGGGWISDGESVMMVSDDPKGVEWSIIARTEQVEDGGTQILETRAVTENVWEAYHGFQDVVDLWSGYSNQTVYAFSESRTHSYTVSSTPDDDIVVQWYNRPVALSAALATATEMEFIVTDIYDIVEVLTYQETINVVLIQWGLDSPLGKSALLGVLLFIGMVFAAFTPGVGRRIEWYMVVWTGIGMLYIVGGFSTSLVTIVYTILTIGMWFYVLTIGGQDNPYDA